MDRYIILCLGESGLGKSTLVNSLFLTNLYIDRCMPDVSGKPNIIEQHLYTTYKSSILDCREDWIVKCINISFAEKIARTVSITKSTLDIVEEGVNLRLTVIDTPGFGDALNNHERYFKFYMCHFFVYVPLIHMTVVLNLY